MLQVYCAGAKGKAAAPIKARGECFWGSVVANMSEKKDRALEALLAWVKERVRVGDPPRIGDMWSTPGRKGWERFLGKN